MPLSTPAQPAYQGRGSASQSSANRRNLPHSNLIERSLELSPLSLNADVLLYSEQQPGTDDERIVTTRMMRFDRGTGLLIYTEDNPTYLLKGNCIQTVEDWFGS